MASEIPQPTSSLQVQRESKLEKARKMRDNARKNMESYQSFDSVEYWQCRKEEGEALLDILRLKLKERFREDRQNERELKRMLWKQQEAIKTAQRKIDRFLAREAVIKSVKEDNCVSLSSGAAFLELLLSMRTKTNRTGQVSFTDDLDRQYRDENGDVWSPIHGDYISRQECKAAHIFPLTLGQNVMSYIFGSDADGEINTAKNGLFLPKRIESAFDSHQITIVPLGPDNLQQWKLFVIDRTGLWNAKVLGAMRFSDIHNMELKFPPNATLPRARYFYFHYMMAMLIQGRKDQKSRACVKDGLEEASTPELARVWATKGRYLREHMIRGFIEGLGHAVPDAEQTLVSYIDDTIPESPEALLECMDDIDLMSETSEDIEADLEKREMDLAREREEWEEEKQQKEYDMENAIYNEDWEFESTSETRMKGSC